MQPQSTVLQNWPVWDYRLLFWLIPMFSEKGLGIIQERIKLEIIFIELSS